MSTSSNMKRSTKLLMVGFVLLLICWWWQAWNFSDRFVAGTYVAKNTPIGSCNLIELKSDHSFKQQLWMGDRVALPAVGTWSRFGEAGVAFSKSFLGSNPDEVAKDNVYGMFRQHVRISHTDRRSADQTDQIQEGFLSEDMHVVTNTNPTLTGAEILQATLVSASLNT